jgi:hypothetical protein
LHACSHGSVTIDKKGDVLDLEEKELADEEEVDRLLLQSICGETMEEVMDFGGDWVCHTHQKYYQEQI